MAEGPDLKSAQYRFESDDGDQPFVAQWIEQDTSNVKAIGSNPIEGALIKLTNESQRSPRRT